VKFLLIVIVLVAVLLAVPAVRRLVLRTRDQVTGQGVSPLMSGARDRGQQVMSARVGKQLATLGRTLVIDAPAERVGPLLTAAVKKAAFFDPGPGAPGEALAWVHRGVGTSRLAAVPDASGRTVFGCVEFEFVMRAPQGGEAVETAVGKVSEALQAEGIAFEVLVRTFTPGPSLSADGPRVADPLG